MTTQARVGSERALLVRLGFADAEDVLRRLHSLPAEAVEVILGEPVRNALAAAADPDAAAVGLAGLVEALRDDVGTEGLEDLLRELPGPTGRRLCAVLGASDALARHLRRHPEHWRECEDGTGAELPDVVTSRAGFDSAQREAPAWGTDPGDALRVEYRRQLIRIAAADVADGAPYESVAAALADLAAATLQSALAVAAGEVADADTVRLTVVAMGKCGGRELNYVSDVDVVFVAEPRAGSDDAAAVRAATRWASTMMRICSEHTGEGTVWQVDAALRPEGKAGPLVRTLDSHRAYYERWAKTWEFQALLKARAVAGDDELGSAYEQMAGELVWQAAERPGFVEDVQAMRRRVVDNIRGEAEREIKLGPGGLRDVEFAVQLLQLVHGRGDTSIRSRNTLTALGRLTAGGYVGREDGTQLACAYRFLRTCEHRVQLLGLRRTHEFPEAPDELRRIARSMGLTADPVTELEAAWRRARREVRRLHEQLFYRPLLQAVARIPTAEVRLTTDAAASRLRALGFTDPARALRQIEALTGGVSRRAAIQRTLLPAMLAWFADSPDADAGLAAYRRLSEALGESPWYLRQLRDEGASAERLARLLAAGSYPAELLQHAPEACAMLADADELTPRPVATLIAEAEAAARRHEQPDRAIAAVRAVRRRERLRIVAAQIAGLLDVEAVGEALSDIARATLAGALAVAWRRVDGEAATVFAVVAMGRLGGHEMNLGSDADVMFVHDPLPGADATEAGRQAQTVATELGRLLSLPGSDPPMKLDTGLRPEGKQGPLVRTLASYDAYYARWSKTWEAQALLRAEPLIGPEELLAAFTRLIDPLRYPVDGLTPDDVIEIRRIKARVDAERLPRGSDPATHTKLGRGGLSDIEWTVQLLQLQHAHRVEGLRTTRTLPALRAAAEAGVLTRRQATTLTDAWVFVSRVRNAIMLVRGRASDSLPREPRELAAVAHSCGYGPGQLGRFTDDHLRVTRRARAVVDQLFWGTR